jgi:hypothetical protein
LTSLIACVNVNHGSEKHNTEDGMKIAKNDKFWVVSDPTSVSTLDDILFETTLTGLENQIIGAMRLGYRMTDSDKNMVIYSDGIKARKDAESRLTARDA